MENQIFYKSATIEMVKGADGKETWKSILSSTSVDFDGERMSKKALDMAAIDLRTHKSVFFNHDHKALPVARFDKTEVVNGAAIGKDAAEYYLVVDMIPSMAKGVEDVVVQVREGTLNCMSIGGKTLKSFDETSKSLEGVEKKVRVLDEIKALEGSIVGIGANPDAMMMGIAKGMFISSMKGMEEKSMVEEIKKENGPSTPNEPSLASSPGAHVIDPLSVPKKKTTDKKSGMECEEIIVDSKAGAAKSYEDELASLRKENEELKTLVSETKKSVDLIKDAMFTRKGVVDLAGTEPKSEKSLAKSKMDNFRKMVMENAGIKEDGE